MKLQPPPPQSLVIFGASGDLARRKVIPALYNLAGEGLLPQSFAIVGYARRGWETGDFRSRAREAVEEFSRTPLDAGLWESFSESMSYVSGPFDTPGCFDALSGHLGRIDDELGTEGRRVYYCATPPGAFPLIVRRLGECGSQENTRIVIEKPFGRDLETATELNESLHVVFNEPQIFRIDHYLGKETVQNILVLRFANSLFERAWNRDAIDHVQITVAEQAGIEGRGAYYEEAGAIRDVIQSHMLQVLALLAMEPPRSLEPEAIRDEKVKLLRAFRRVDPADVVRGQYSRGTVGGEEVPGYREEEGVAPDSAVETFAAVRAWVDNWRWDGVPFFLRTGKRLPRRTTEVAVTLRKAPAYLFEALGISSLGSDRLTIRVQPDEGISLAFHAKEPGPGISLQNVRMDFTYHESFRTTPAEAYERLIYDAMSGDQTLFTRQDEVDRAWEVFSPVLKDPGPVHPYWSGSWGPSAADEFIAPLTWHLG